MTDGIDDKTTRPFSNLALIIIVAGWIGFAVYVSLALEIGGAVDFIRHFLSTERSGIRFRALVFFAPLLLTIIGFLVNEREKYHKRTSRSASELDKLNDDLLTYNERLSTLHKIQTALSSSLELGVVLNVLAEEVVRQFHVDAAAVLLVEPEKRELSYAAGTGFVTERIKGISIRVGESCAGAVAREGRKILIPDIENSDSPYVTEGNYPFTESYLVREEGFKAYFAFPLKAKGRSIGVLEIYNRSVHEFEDKWTDYIEALATQAAIAIENASLYDRLQQSKEDLVRAYDSSISGWSRALDLSEKESEGHSGRVTDLVMRLGRALGLGDEDLTHLRRGALLHDIGIISIPDRILFKDRELSNEERAVIERHPVIGYELLSPIEFLRPALVVLRHHHERWDGAGYPDGLMADEIPLLARVFMVVDVYDSLRMDRPFRKAWPEAEVRTHLRAQSGRHFDPEIVETFLRMIGGE